MTYSTTWIPGAIYPLTNWKDERIVFSIYLPEVLADKFHAEFDGIIPEFPVHKGTITNSLSNQSDKIDYLAKAKNKIFFVELKTDAKSRRITQDAYLEQAKQAGMTNLLDGLRKIYKATSSKEKYHHLLVALEGLGLIKLEGSDVFHISPGEYDIEIVYIQPNNPYGQENVISFEDFSEIVERQGDEVSLRFAESLRRWAGTKAGER